MAAEDFPNAPADHIPDLDPSSSLSGNRPASGARRATPGEVLSQGFHGAENAGDFLGLDTEFTASQDPGQVFGAHSPLDLVPPPSTYAEGAEVDQAQPFAAEPQAGDPTQSFSDSPSAFEFGEDLGSDDGEPAAGEESAPSRRPLLVKALLVAGLAGGGVFYGSKLYQQYFGATTVVAVVPPPPAPAKEAPPDVAPLGEASGTRTTEPVAPTKAPEAAAQPGPVVTSSKEPRKPNISPRATGSSGSGAARKPEPESTLTPLAGSGPSLPAAGASGAAERPSSGFPQLGSAEYAWASPDLLELIWRGSHVPLEAVRAPAKTLMPRVGNVRVFTTAGDVFDGRLFAVGQNRVWVDAEPGRIGLDGERVERIEVLGPVAEGPGAAEAPELAGKKRVRVRVPGGTLYGSVLKAEGDDVILALDDGGRVRVKAGDIEDLGPGRAVVVRR